MMRSMPPAPTICRLFGHKFRPRYHERKVAPEWVKVGLEAPAGLSVNGTIVQDITKTYLYDVCVRCGIRTEEDTP
jgi:hypothetical protein